MQYGHRVPITSKGSRIRIDLQPLDHFLSFITNPHLVHNLQFGEKHLQLSSGQIITTPNVIRTMIPEWIIMQYSQYWGETNFKPLSHSTVLRIFTECSASVRKSLQRLDYFAAEGAKAFDYLIFIIQEIALQRADRAEWATMMQDSLKEGKLYQK